MQRKCRDGKNTSNRCSIGSTTRSRLWTVTLVTDSETTMTVSFKHVLGVNLMMMHKCSSEFTNVNNLAPQDQTIDQTTTATTTTTTTERGGTRLKGRLVSLK